MGLLIGDLLTLARADAGDARLTLTPEPFGEFAAGVVEQLQPLALERRVGLLWLGDEPGPIVQGDRMRLTQLALNLVDNALKNAPEGVVRVSVRQEGESAVFEVSDNGIGIAPEHLPHIFDRFYRIDEARSRRKVESAWGFRSATGSRVRTAAQSTSKASLDSAAHSP
ncbi:MAG: HAMP domain-containing sensor histidine kinase [Chloroflexia bacterium]